MHFSSSYALLFGLSGFASALYHLKTGNEKQLVPLVGLVFCVLYSGVNYGISYGFLTLIEYGAGFGLAHFFLNNKGGLNKND